MPPFDDSPIVRLRPRPAEPDSGPPAIDHHRPRIDGKRSRRPHNDLTVQRVKYFIERTTLTYSDISEKTGVGRASISRWSRDFKWARPLDAPISTDWVPTERALRRKRLRMLAGRLLALAEDMIRRLEENPGTDVEALMAALQVLKMARLEDQGRRRMRREPATFYTGSRQRDALIAAALKEMRRGGVDLDRVPETVMELFIEARAPEETNVGYVRKVRPHKLVEEACGAKVLSKVAADLKDEGVTNPAIRAKIDEVMATAILQVKAGT